MMTPTAEATNLTAIERLADKVSALVQLLDRTRSDLAEATAENARLKRELEQQTALNQQYGEELQTLRAEREQLQTKMASMLDQLESIEL